MDTENQTRISEMNSNHNGSKEAESTSQRTVFLLSTYPFQRPRHGGQIRLSKIVNTYRASGFIVHSLAVYENDHYTIEDLSLNDIPMPSSGPFQLYQKRSVPYISDFLAGKFSASDEGAFRIILGRVPERVDIIHIEQPWLLPLAKRLRKEYSACRHACLIYGSQNIEAPLKKSIFKHYKVRANDVLKEIEALEIEAAKEAHLTLAVTSEDKSVLERFGAQNVILIPNGVSSWQASEERLDYWRSRLPSVPWILFIASAHHPNYTGFVDCVGNSLAYIPPDSRLVIVGSVGDHIYSILSKTRWRDINLSRLTLLSVLNDHDVAAVKTLAHAFLLPILDGGGSNLKTAEALYSGKYVVCTPNSLRGFEAYHSLPKVFVAESQNDFRKAICNVLRSPPTAPVTPESAEIRKKLLWDHCLIDLSDAIQKLVL
jgi:glycosyltransferase involved in cell wall biosynthesis